MKRTSIRFLFVLLVALAAPVRAQDEGVSAEELYERAISLPAGELEARLELCDRALLLATGPLEPGLEIGLHVCAGEALLGLERYEESLAHHDQATALATESGDEWALMISLYNTAFICTHLGDFDRSLEAARDVALLAERLEQPQIRVQAQNMIGVACERMGDREGAMQAYGDALAMVADSGDWSVSYALLNNLSVLNMNAGHLDEALEFFEQGLEVAEQAGDLVAVASTIANIGDVHFLAKRYDEALSKYQLALDARVKFSGKGDVAQSHSRLGDVYIELGEHKLAIEHLEQALEIQEGLGLQPEIVATLSHLSRAYSALDRDIDALDAATESSELAEVIQARTWRVKALRELATAHEANGDFASALEVERKASELDEELNSLEAARAFAELSASADARWREIQQNAEIASLERDGVLAQSELERQAMLRRFLIACGALVLVLALVGWSAYLFRGRASDALERSHTIEKRLLEAQKLESLGLLSGGVAHDFNNILTVINGNSELARIASVGDDRVQAHLADIELACKRATEVAQQMLYYAGRNDPKRVAVDFGSLTRETIHLLRKTAPEQIEIEADVEPDLPIVYGDNTQLGQVVLNLITNAFEAIGDQPGRISARVSRLAVTNDSTREWTVFPGTYVCLEVEDNGGGVAQDRLSKLFDPFFTGKQEGLGLGLATVQGIVRRHGGEVHVESELGQGTVFTALLKVTEAPVLDTVLAPAIAPGSTANRLKRALVIDDEMGVLKTTGQMLEVLDWNSVLVSEADAGLEAIESDEHFDFVILDLVMPGTDVADTLATMKSFRPELPILLVSGFDRYGIIDELGNYEAVAFLQKPFGIADLEKSIVELLAATDPELVEPGASV